MKRLLGLWIVVVTLGGCALFTSPPSRPVVQDSVGNQDKRIGTLATVGQRRMVLIKFEDGKFCAEPPPDAVDNIAATLFAALSAKTETINASASLGAALSTYAKQLLYRSQGLQLYRDGMFSLCNAYLNKAITEDDFKKKQEELLKVASELIKAELPYLQYIKTDVGGTPPAPSLPSPQPPPGNPPSGGATPPGK